MNATLINLNKRDIRDYQVEKKFIAGLVLFGCEAKSLRKKQASLSGTYISIQKEEVFIHNLIIRPYQNSRIKNNLKRKIKLLLQRKEINKIIKELATKNKILLPISIIDGEKGWIKLEFAISQHLRKYQIKNEIKEKEIKKKIVKKDF